MGPRRGGRVSKGAAKICRRTGASSVLKFFHILFHIKVAVLVDITSLSLSLSVAVFILGVCSLSPGAAAPFLLCKRDEMGRAVYGHPLTLLPLFIGTYRRVLKIHSSDDKCRRR